MQYKSKSFSFDVDIYNTRVNILYLFSDEQLQKYIEDNFPGAVYKRTPGATAAAMTFIHSSGAEEPLIDFLTPFKIKDPKAHSTISHETIHVAWDILETHGIIIDSQNHEALSYLVGFIVKKINEGLFDGK